MGFHGFLNIDKPLGITSRDAVDRVAHWFPRKTKVGHAGTLDPLATGVLVIAIGQATRLVEYVQAMPKTYRTSIVLGAASDTDDADGTITPNPNAIPVDADAIRSALARFVGEIEQVPPAYSAAHVAGKRAYDLARRGDQFALTPRRVRIDRIDLLSATWPDLELEVQCGKGAYIRSIARDLGVALGVGGYVRELRRLRIGPFAAEDAIALTGDAETARQRLLPMMAALAGLPTIRVTADDARRLRTGQSVPAQSDGVVVTLDAAGELVAIGYGDRGILRPEKAFATIGDD